MKTWIKVNFYLIVVAFSLGAQAKTICGRDVDDRMQISKRNGTMEQVQRIFGGTNGAKEFVSCREQDNIYLLIYFYSLTEVTNVFVWDAEISMAEIDALEAAKRQTVQSILKVEIPAGAEAEAQALSGQNGVFQKHISRTNGLFGLGGCSTDVLENLVEAQACTDCYQSGYASCRVLTTQSGKSGVDLIGFCGAHSVVKGFQPGENSNLGKRECFQESP